ncbi:MAG: GYD domain-containing protein [Rhodospirillaceae bacterium]|jgi:uncharacterized protein with GYD domain|nr:GYD domain-containing protein [Rhodospirillaceae bacterium]
MATFIYLMNLTDEGVKGISDAPSRRAGAEKMIGDLGGELVGTWLTMGMYDRVLIVNFLQGDAAAKFAIGMGKKGFSRLTTLRGFDNDEALALINAAP